MLRLLAQIAGAALFTMVIVRGHGATLSLETRTIPGLSPKSAIVQHTIRLTGPIDAGDTDRLRKMLERLRATTPAGPGAALATVELSSTGGDLYEGLKLGYLFREFDVATVVRAADVCLSACALAFLGGTQSHAPGQAVPSRSLEIGGQVGFHNFYLTSPSELSAATKDAREGVAMGFSVARGGASALVRYAAQMGIDAAFVARMMGQTSDVWDYVETDDQFITLKVCPLGLSRPPPNPAAIAANICNHVTGGLGRASPLQARGLSPREARRHLLERVRDTAEAASVKSPLAAQLAAVLASRDEALVESVYVGLRSAGVPLPEVLGSNFEVTGYSLGGVPLECHVSMSRDNPGKFDVALDTPDGMVKPFERPSAACPMPFLFDAEDVLNPRR